MSKDVRLWSFLEAACLLFKRKLPVWYNAAHAEISFWYVLKNWCVVVDWHGFLILH